MKSLISNVRESQCEKNITEFKEKPIIPCGPAVEDVPYASFVFADVAPFVTNSLLFVWNEILNGLLPAKKKYITL